MSEVTLYTMLYFFMETDISLHFLALYDFGSCFGYASTSFCQNCRNFGLFLLKELVSLRFLQEVHFQARTVEDPIDYHHFSDLIFFLGLFCKF